METKDFAKSKEKFMERIKKAGSEEYETSWENGIPKSKKKSKIKKGKSSRARGARFELKVRKDLESQGFTLDKWTNNVDLDEGKLVKVKNLFRGKNIPMMLGAGFPDFIAIKQIREGAYNIIGVEVKINGILLKIEKEKCKFYLKQKLFSKILIAKAIKEGRKLNIEYIDFEKKYGK